jgi:hypothetical protein
MHSCAKRFFILLYFVNNNVNNFEINSYLQFVAQTRLTYQYSCFPYVSNNVFPKTICSISAIYERVHDIYINNLHANEN